MKGDIVARGDHALVVPEQAVDLNPANWIDLGVLMRDGAGRVWHRGGEIGSGQDVGGAPALMGAFQQELCDPEGPHCIVGRVSPARLFDSGPIAWSAAAVANVLIAALFTSFLVRLTRYLVSCGPPGQRTAISFSILHPRQRRSCTRRLYSALFYLVAT